MLVASIYIACDMAAVIAGAVVLLDALGGRLICTHAAFFLRCALCTSIAGLLYRPHCCESTSGLSVLVVYVTALAFVAWRRFHLVSFWWPLFLVSMSSVMYASVLVGVVQFSSLPSIGHYNSTHVSLMRASVEAVLAALGVVAICWVLRQVYPWSIPQPKNCVSVDAHLQPRRALVNQ